MFENSADFFGRIIVYSLDVLGEKASWPFFSPLMRERKWPLSESTGCRMVWWHLGNMSSVLPPHELLWMWPFLVWKLQWPVIQWPFAHFDCALVICFLYLFCAFKIKAPFQYENNLLEFFFLVILQPSKIIQLHNCHISVLVCKTFWTLQCI